MKFICISDTHGRHHDLRLPEADVLIHAGDFCNTGNLAELRDFSTWLAEQPYRHKVVIAGNHDRILQNDPELAEPLLAPFTYLLDSQTEIEGLKIYGSPWQPRFFNWAFNLDRGEPIRQKWRMIPNDVDVLITHGPMYGVGDLAHGNNRVGCQDLFEEVTNRVKPKYHVCGHIHEGRGTYQVGETLSINASCLVGHFGLHAQPWMSFEL